MDTNQTGEEPAVSNMPNLYWAYGVTVALLALLIIVEIYLLPSHCAGEAGGLGNSIGMTVLVAGMLGGFVRSIVRTDKDVGDPTQAPRSVLVMQKLAHVLLGGIFAIVLYLIFAGQMLSGSLFPAFANVDVTSFSDFLCKTKPHAIPDYAKALVWAFLAGYSQVAMRNLFDDLVNKAVGGNKGAGKPGGGKQPSEKKAMVDNPSVSKASDAKPADSKTKGPEQQKPQ